MNKEDSFTWWKLLILLTFILSIVSLLILIPKPHYEYRTQHIILDNTNIFESWDVIDYTCDEGVLVDNHKTFKKFYASTWEGSIGDKPKVSYGQCLVKIREFKGWS